jgi:hypothetical protein
MKNKFLLLVLLLVILLVVLFSKYRYSEFLGICMYIRSLVIYNEHKWLHRNMFKIFPNIKNLSIDSIQKPEINIYRHKINEYKIIDMERALYNAKKLRELKDIDTNIRVLLTDILPHVNINGRKIKIDDCIIVDMLVANGSYFNSFHTDVEWGIFDNSDGFQVWYLIENKESSGNMFILDTDKVKPSMGLTFQKDGIIKMKDQNSELTEYLEPNIVYDNIQYLDMKAGECFIFGKSLFHMSDFRSRKRSAINFRVVVKDSDGGIPINISRESVYTWHFKKRIRKIPQINGKIYTGLTDLLHFF